MWYLLDGVAPVARTLWDNSWVCLAAGCQGTENARLWADTPSLRWHEDACHAWSPSTKAINGRETVPATSAISRCYGPVPLISCAAAQMSLLGAALWNA
jgi:hypothetical protein